MSDVLVMEILTDEIPLVASIDFQGEYVRGGGGAEIPADYGKITYTQDRVIQVT